MAKVTSNPVPFKTHIPNVRTFQVSWPGKYKMAGLKVLSPLEGVVLEKYKSYTSGMKISVWFDPSKMESQMEKPAYEELECQFTSRSKYKFALRLEYDNVEPRCDECYHCGKRYSDDDPPKHMSCGHCFCLECLSQLFREHQDDKRVVPINYQCPIDGKKLDKTPATTPSNRGLLEVVRKMRKDEELEKEKGPQIVENPYIPCIESADHESTKYCMQCKEAFCESCFNRSHSFKIMSGHQSVPVAEKPTIMPMCSLHPNNQAYFICEEESCQDDKYICDTCLNGSHNHHRNRLTKKDCDNNEKFLTEAESEYDSLDSVLQQNYESVEHCIETFDPGCPDRKRVMEMFDETMEQEVKKARKRFEDKLDIKVWSMVVKKDELRETSQKIHDSKNSALRMLRLKDFLHPEVQKNREMMNKLREDVNVHDRFQSITDYVEPGNLVSVTLRALDPAPEPPQEVRLIGGMKLEPDY